MITSFRISPTFYLQDNRLQIFLSIYTCNIFRRIPNVIYKHYAKKPTKLLAYETRSL